MTTPALIAPRARHLAALFVPLFILSGCASDQFGSQLSAHPKARAIDRPEGTTLHLPQDQPFNITLPRATKQPGLEGTAEVDATAKPNGDAAASASVTNGGSAEAVFQLGHAVSNATEKQVDFEFHVHLQYEFEAQASTELSLPDATVGLRLYARYEQGRLIRDIALVGYTTENGATKRQSTENVNFTLPLGPGDSLSVFIAGQAKVEVPASRSASRSIKISDFQIEVLTRPAPAVRTAENGKD